jgi:plastocyanin
MARNLMLLKSSLARTTIVLIAAFILTTAARVGSLARESSPPSSGSAPPNVVKVAIRSYAFDPATVTVHAGDTVEWKNYDSVDHTATAEGGDPQKPAFDSGNIQQGKSWSFAAGKKGTYNYKCTLHPFMKGQLIVE